jgi:hypothetical protein
MEGKANAGRVLLQQVLSPCTFSLLFDILN